MTLIHIVCSAKNAERYLGAFVDGLVAQTHREWALWIRDDGSTDGTWALLQKLCAREPRIVFLVRGSGSWGSVRGFGSLLAQLPADATVVACGDADDVWMPQRLERTLAALQEAERESAGPILIHSDLVVVDEELQVIAPSFWRSERVDPDFPSLRSLAIQNVAVGPTLLFNGALLAELRTVPATAIHQDWWIALVAAVTGRVVAVREPTVLYRQHGANTAGARLSSTWARLGAAWSVRGRVARDLDNTARQAAAVVERFGDRLSPVELQALQGLASIAELRGWRRRVAIVRWRWLRAHGVPRNVGVVLRG